jgi:hypothetical protein
VEAGRRPEIVSASEWGAAPPLRPLPPRGPLDHVVVHHTAAPSRAIGGTTRAAEAKHVREIQRWHRQRGFATIGYHFVVSPSGRIFRGRPLDRLGAHVQGHNPGTVGICLMGDFEREQPTRAALASLDFIRQQLVPGAHVPLLGHRDHRGHERNACPGRFLYEQTRARRAPGPRGPLAAGVSDPARRT